MLQLGIEVRQPFAQTLAEAFQEALADRELMYTAASLIAVGYEPGHELSTAVERAMLACTRCGLNVSHHFRPVYIADDHAHELRKDWRLSKLAYTLVMLHGDADNPVAARLQMELLKGTMPPRRQR